jgi:hypothetical protein
MSDAALQELLVEREELSAMQDRLAAHEERAAGGSAGGGGGGAISAMDATGAIDGPRTAR